MIHYLLVLLLAVVAYAEQPFKDTRIPITADLVNASTWQNVGIVGGDPVSSASSYPWMAAYLDSRNQFCGASVIAPGWALTAAHCVSSSRPTSEEISVGSLRYDGRGTPPCVYYKVGQTFRHPSWNPSTLDWDVALLKLTTNINFGTNVQPVDLAPADSNDFADSPATCTGWGTTSSGGTAPLTLREVTYPIISNAECSTMYSGITARMLCAYEPGKDSCQGDSGGPYFLKNSAGVWQQVGIVSWGIGCAGEGAPGVYTRVSSVVSWICSVSGVGC